MILTVNSELFSNEGGFLNVKTINIKIYFHNTSNKDKATYSDSFYQSLLSSASFVGDWKIAWNIYTCEKEYLQS